METKYCKKCGKEIDDSYGSGKYCSRKCANSRNINSEIKETKSAKCKKCGCNIRIDKRADINNSLCDDCSARNKPRFIKIKKIKYCKMCGAIKGQCKHPDICRKHRLIPNLIKYFGFDETSIGTEKYYKEFDRVRNLLIEDYYDNNLSIQELCEKFNHYNYSNFTKILRSCNIELRLNSKSKTNSDSHTNYWYHQFWYVTWNNKKVFLRSDYEFDYAKELDSLKIDYEVEKLRILYWDSQLLRQRIAIPDFYLPETNTIVEIKVHIHMIK